MGKKICGLIIMLAFLGGIFAWVPVAYATAKTDRPATFGCDAKSVTVEKNGNKMNIKWKYDPRLEGTNVKINLYKNGNFLRTIADNISIGNNARGSWSGSWDWGNRAPGNLREGKVYQIEIVSLVNSNLRVKGDIFAEEDPVGTLVN